MPAVGADLGRQQNKLKNIQDVMGGFTIKAPAAGMVIYVREWNGKKKGVGSQWSAWDPPSRRCPTSRRWSRRPTSTRSTSERSPWARR